MNWYGTGFELGLNFKLRGEGFEWFDFCILNNQPSSIYLRCLFGLCRWQPRTLAPQSSTSRRQGRQSRLEQEGAVYSNRVSL